MLSVWITSAFELQLAQGSPFYVAVLLASLVGGAASGAVALVLSIVSIWVVIIPHAYIFEIASVPGGVSLGMYAGTLGLTAVSATHYRTLVHRLDAEELHRKIVVQELGHRVKNKLATVAAIVCRELRSHPELLTKINGRLQALSSADDFVAKTNGEGAFVRDVITLELAPYDPARFTIEFEDDDVFCPAKPAVLVALVLHELVTNAVKYGALSSDTGRINISCASRGDRIELIWIENAGRYVVPPAKTGFGTALLREGLSAWDCRTKVEFLPTGLSYNLSFRAGTTKARSQDATASSICRPALDSSQNYRPINILEIPASKPFDRI